MFSAENTTIQGLINAMLLIIPIGCMFRIGWCGLVMIQEEEERGKYKRRAQNAGLFLAVAESAVAIVNLAYKYFG